MLSGKKFQLVDKQPRYFDLHQSLNALSQQLCVQDLILDNGGESVVSKGPETLSLDFSQWQNLYQTLLHSGEKFTIEYLSNWHERSRQETQLFSERYKPQNLSDMCGNCEQIQEMRAWMNNWIRGRERKPLLIHGPPGIGKTTSVELLAKEFDFGLIEYDSSDNRSKKSIDELQEKIVSRIVGCHDTVAFLKRRESKPLKKLIFMDEIDGISGNGDRGGLTAMKNLLNSIGKGFSKFNNSVPIVMACNILNTSTKSFREILKDCIVIEFERPDPQVELRPYLERIFGENAHIVRACEMQDIRRAFNYLQLKLDDAANETIESDGNFTIDYLETKESVSRRAFLHCNSLSNESLIDAGEKIYKFDRGLMPHYAFENIYRRFSKVEHLQDLTNCADSLSDYDLMINSSWQLNRQSDSLLDTLCAFNSITLPIYYARETSSSQQALKNPLFSRGILSENAKITETQKEMSRTMPAFQSTYWLSAIERSETMRDIFKATVEQIKTSIQEAKSWQRGSSIYPVKIACVDGLIRMMLYYDNFFITDKSTKINHVEKNNLVKVWRKLESQFLKTASKQHKLGYENIKKKIDADFVNRYLKQASQFQLRYARTNDIQLCQLREKLLQCKSSETEIVLSEKCPHVTPNARKKRRVTTATPSRLTAKTVDAKRIKRK